MYPVTHVTIAIGSVWLGGRFWRRLRGGSAVDAIDYRFAAFGALVPDLIDKPLKWFIFPDTLPDDHVYGHTLLLPLCLIAAGLLLARRGDLRLLVLGLGCLTHPLVDPTNTYPRTLLWPLLGTEFPVSHQERGPLQPALEGIIVGSGLLALARRQNIRDWARRFVRTGAVSPPEAPSETPHRGVSTA